MIGFILPSCIIYQDVQSDRELTPVPKPYETESGWVRLNRIIVRKRRRRSPPVVVIVAKRFLLIYS